MTLKSTKRQCEYYLDHGTVRDYTRTAGACQDIPGLTHTDLELPIQTWNDLASRSRLREDLSGLSSLS